MTRAILLQCSSRLFSFDAVFLFRFEMITCKNCMRTDYDLIRAVDFARV